MKNNVRNNEQQLKKINVIFLLKYTFFTRYVVSFFTKIFFHLMLFHFPLITVLYFFQLGYHVTLCVLEYFFD